MTPRQQAVLKIVILSLIIAFGMGVIINAVSTASSFPEASISYRKNFPDNKGNVVVVLYPQKAFVPDDNITAIVAVSLPNDYIAKHKTFMEACFPDAWVSYNDLFGLMKGQDMYFDLNNTEHIANYTSTTFFKIVNVNYVAEGNLRLECDDLQLGYSFY